MRKCCVRELGRVAYGEALELQRQLVAARKLGETPDHLLLLEHPHVITLGRNGHMENLLAGEDILDRAGISFYPTDRGGDVTYHGPGQLVGYPILDLREWKRDVGAYVRGIEQVIIDTLADFGISAGRIPKLTGVWVDERKIAAIGVHISRWVTSHGFALNVNTDLELFPVHRSLRTDQAGDLHGAAWRSRHACDEVGRSPGRAFRPRFRLRDAARGPRPRSHGKRELT